MTNIPNADTADTVELSEVIAFLQGEGPLQGVWFGEKPEGERGNFWWRKHLRAAMRSAVPSGAAEALEGPSNKRAEQRVIMTADADLRAALLAAYKEVDRVVELSDGEDALRERMSDLLTRVANALRGEPGPLAAHSWHDLPERAAAAIAARGVTDEMVTRFLGWKLPADFNPDCGVSFKQTHSESGPWGPQKHEPIGTNLLNADQARAMLEHVLATPPAAGVSHGEAVEGRTVWDIVGEERPRPASMTTSPNEAMLHLIELVGALQGAFISSWQSTHHWQKQLDEAQDFLNRQPEEPK